MTFLLRVYKWDKPESDSKFYRKAVKGMSYV